MSCVVWESFQTTGKGGNIQTELVISQVEETIQSSRGKSEYLLQNIIVGADIYVCGYIYNYKHME